MLDDMSPRACDNKEQICRCDLCTRRVRTIFIERSDASAADAGARKEGTDRATVRLPYWSERLVPRR